jgi:signal transduction histidine kinase/ActR/RegA family two-component response regulator/HAMP domain-containing protein
MKDESSAVGPRTGYLQSRLLLIVLAVALPLTALLGLSIVDARRDAERQAFLSLRQRADQTAQQMIGMLEKTEHLLVFMSTRHRISLLDREACESWVSGASDAGIYYTNVGLVALDGTLVCSSRPAAGRVHFAGFAWFQAGLAAPGLWLSDPLRGPISGRMVQYMTLPVRDAAGGKVGLLAASIDLAALNRALEPQIQGSDVAVGIQKGGVFVTRLPDPQRWMGQPVPERLRLRGVPDTEPRLAIGLDGQQRAYAWVDVPRYGLQAVAAMPQDKVYAQANQQAWRHAAGAAATIACALLVASLVARRLSAALKSIADTARQLHAGATQVRADAALPGEFGVVAEEFNRLMDRNDQRADELRQSERRAIRLRRFHETLSATGQAIARQASAAELVEAVCRACTHSGLADSALVCEGPAQHFRVIAAAGAGDDGDRQADLAAAEARAAAAAVEQGDTVLATAADGATVAAVPFALDPDAGAAGVLVLRARGGEPFEGELARLLVALAREISLGLDLDRHREARAALAAAQAESQAKTAFLSHVSHELRTPLTAVLGFAQLVQSKAVQRDDIEDRQRLGHVLAAGRQLMALIDDLMDVSRIEGGVLRLEMTDVDVADLLASVMHLSQPLADARRVTLQLDVGDTPGLTIHTDPVRLRQVFTNLVSNGVKYNRAGGWVRVGAASDASRVRLFVRDGGIGMTPAQQRNLFQAFNRLGREHSDIQGTGIGLLITKGLIELLGGDLAFQSEQDVGTTFTVTLPVGAVVGAAGAPARDAAAPSPVAGVDAVGTVLYIEDNEVNALLVQQVLAALPGVQVVVCPTAGEGVWVAAQLQPHLVLMDMQLPDADGIEILARLRGDPATAALRVIALSSSAMPDEVAAALRAGAQAYWTKPIDFEALRAGVAEVVREESARRAADGARSARAA